MVGEALAPVCEKIRIATKFGWDIDQETGRHRGGVNSKPAYPFIPAESMIARVICF